MSDETVAQKITSIQRCAAQARKALAEAQDEFRTNYLFQDAAVLNVIRACETSIDLANMLIRAKRLGIPAESRDSFAILARENLIDIDLGRRLERMVGFRNVAVHRYRDLDLEIVESVIRKDLDDLLTFAEAMRAQLRSS
jgi:uncharacterized protein YutE (UPF0331/DUF86 family)